MHTVAVLCTYFAIASASFSDNINYGSPSLRHPALGVALHKVVKRQAPGRAYNPSQLNFTHGVASGDPYSDSVILWTRISPMSDNDRSNVTVNGTAPLYNHEAERYVKVSRSPVCVTYKIGTDEELSDASDSEPVYTSSDIDFTVKVSPATLLVTALYLLKNNRWKPRT